MKKFTPLFVVLLGLTACAGTTQGKLVQAVYALDSAYHIAAAPIPDIIAAGYLNADQKVLAKEASQIVYNELDALNTKIIANESLTPSLVEAATTDLDQLKQCVSDLKNKELVAAQTSCKIN